MRGIWLLDEVAADGHKIHMTLLTLTRNNWQGDQRQFLA